MDASPSAAPPSSMEASQQPISSQRDEEAGRSPVTCQPVGAEQQAPPTTTPDAEQGDEERNMDHLTVISDHMESSKYSRPAPAHRHRPAGLSQ